MVKRTGGPRRKTRYKFSKRRNERGKISIRMYLQKFKEGDKVLMKLEPSVHEGPYFRRYHAKVGVVKRKRGSCYEVSIYDGNKEKTLVVHPVHLIRQ
ncbi:MAG: 50S ribosomal protein L21e [Nanoarchaeota archaeon]